MDRLHLHQFVTPDATYGMEIPGGELWPEDQRDEDDARLVDLGTKFEYLYDFGDGWTHDVEVLGPGGAALVLPGWIRRLPTRRLRRARRVCRAAGHARRPGPP